MYLELILRHIVRLVPKNPLKYYNNEYLEYHCLNTRSPNKFPKLNLRLSRF